MQRVILVDSGQDSVDENGVIKQLEDKSGERMVNNFFLRDEFPPASRARAPRPSDTPRDHFNNVSASFPKPFYDLFDLSPARDNEPADR